MKEYNHLEIEKKWQEKWANKNIYNIQDKGPKRENEMILVEFPYPSGDLHIGHWYAFAVTDIYARFRKMQGKNVLFPIGFDSFGLPAENAAIKHNINPREWTYKNMDVMRNQLKSMGASFDWSREIATSNPDYYKWTQWLFLKFLEKGLAYQSETNVNWCPKCKTVLANEQVKAGLCERCESEVVQKRLKQWQLKITEYADRLIDDLEEIDWSESIKHSQRNWIGRSEGAKLKFKVKEIDEDIEVFTTRPDTLYGATYIVVAPEHEIVEKLKAKSSNEKEIDKYIEKTNRKTEMDRLANTNEKTGVKIEGVFAINPINNESIPIFVADYVLAQYGTGAIMAVPAHDERDYSFAKKFNLPIVEVISGGDISKEAYTQNGPLINSGELNGLDSEKAKEKVIEKVGGEKTKNYRLRDWLVSRQRYWGCPIPVIHCEKCGIVPVPETDLPVVLPEIDDYLPRDDGKSPLSKSEWTKVKCPKCEAEAMRETDTLDTFVDSSWYYLRYTDPKNDKEFASKEKLEAWMPVNFYSGGSEHDTMHLLFARFFNKVLFDLGLVKNNEPFKKRLSRGLILGSDGNKMSKSKGNVLNPDKIVENMGADTVRTYLAFIGPYNEVGSYPWNQNGIVGMRRFLEKVWKVSNSLTKETGINVNKKLHQVIKRTTEEFSQLKFNAGIAQLMSFINLAEKEGIAVTEFLDFIKLLSVVSPHISEEIWSNLSETDSLISEETWPSFNPELIIEEKVSIAIQIDGKIRGKIDVSVDTEEIEILEKIKEMEEIKKWLENKEIKKKVYVKNKILSLVLE